MVNIEVEIRMKTIEQFNEEYEAQKDVLERRIERALHSRKHTSTFALRDKLKWEYSEYQHHKN